MSAAGGVAMGTPPPIMPPAEFTSSLALASSEALEAAGGGGFEVDGWAEGPNFFFLGTMVDGIVKDRDGDEHDTLRCYLLSIALVFP